MRRRIAHALPSLDPRDARGSKKRGVTPGGRRSCCGDRKASDSYYSNAPARVAAALATHGVAGRAASYKEGPDVSRGSRGLPRDASRPGRPHARRPRDMPRRLRRGLVARVVPRARRAVSGGRGGAAVLGFACNIYPWFLLVSYWTLAKDEQHCQPHPFTRVSK